MDLDLTSRVRVRSQTVHVRSPFVMVNGSGDGDKNGSRLQPSV